MNDEDFQRLLADKRFMNKLAFRVARKVFMELLPWIAILGILNWTWWAIKLAL